MSAMQIVCIGCDKVSHYNIFDDSGTDWLKCERCKNVYYCSLECKEKDKIKHKVSGICDMFREEHDKNQKLLEIIKEMETSYNFQTKKTIGIIVNITNDKFFIRLANRLGMDLPLKHFSFNIKYYHSIPDFMNEYKNLNQKHRHFKHINLKLMNSMVEDYVDENKIILIFITETQKISYTTLIKQKKD